MLSTWLHKQTWTYVSLTYMQVTGSADCSARIKSCHKLKFYAKVETQKRRAPFAVCALLKVKGAFQKSCGNVTKTPSELKSLFRKSLLRAKLYIQRTNCTRTANTAEEEKKEITEIELLLCLTKANMSLSKVYISVEISSWVKGSDILLLEKIVPVLSQGFRVWTKSVEH